MPGLVGGIVGRGSGAQRKAARPVLELSHLTCLGQEAGAAR